MIVLEENRVIHMMAMELEAANTSARIWQEAECRVAPARYQEQKSAADTVLRMARRLGIEDRVAAEAERIGDRLRTAREDAYETKLSA